LPDLSNVALEQCLYPPPTINETTVAMDRGWRAPSSALPGASHGSLPLHRRHHFLGEQPEAAGRQVVRHRTESEGHD